MANFKSKLKRIDRELQDDSVVVVTFTLGSYPLRPDRIPDEGPADMKTALSFNIKDVILLSDAVYGDSRMPHYLAETWGIRPYQMHPDNDEITDEAESDDIPPLEPMVETV